MRPINFPWAIVLARYADKPSVPQPPEYYQDLYTSNGSRWSRGLLARGHLRRPGSDWIAGVRVAHHEPPLK